MSGTRGDREGDIRAHVGSVQLGIRRMQEMVARYGSEVLRLGMEELMRISETKVRHGILATERGGVRGHRLPGR